MPTRNFSASSSEICRNHVDGEPLNENSACNPSNPYGISKLFVNNCQTHREKYGLGVLQNSFNRESPLRGKICKS